MIELLKVPYPYKSMLAFSTDIDGTSLSSFNRIHELFYGLARDAEGLDIELTNSCWVFDDSKKGIDICLHSKDLSESYSPLSMPIMQLIKGGVIDTLHTYGNFNCGSFKREHALFACELFAKHNLQVPIWTYHGSKMNNQNILKAPHWIADNQEQEHYHADVLRALGINYICKPKMEALIHKASPLESIRLADGQIFDGFTRYCRIYNHPTQLEIEKHMLKYKLRFMKNAFKTFSNSKKNSMVVWHLAMLQHQLSRSVLDSLVENNSVVIAAQHLSRRSDPFLYERETLTQLHLLNDAQRNGDVLIAGTARALNYLRMLKHISFDVCKESKTINIKLAENHNVKNIRPNSDCLQGIGFKIRSEQIPQLFVQGRLTKDFRIIKNPCSRGWIAYCPWKRRTNQLRDAFLEFKESVLFSENVS